jgi:hypothetical protein
MKRCIVDTNVLVTANKAVNPDEESLLYPKMIIECIETLLKIKEEQIYVVLDIDDEIFMEYKRYLSFKGQPGVGDAFFKWLNDVRWSFPQTERVQLHKTETGYTEFPEVMESVRVDESDKKFFATSNGHSAKQKPPIYEASDSLWWKWKDAAMQCGIRIIFMDEQYMKDKNL